MNRIKKVKNHWFRRKLSELVMNVMHLQCNAKTAQIPVVKCFTADCCPHELLFFFR